MSIAAGERAGTPEPWSAEELVERLRGLGARYHHLHGFHVRMDAGELSRQELQRWVANRFYYQRCIPLKDAASNWYQSWIVHGYALQTPLQPPESAKEVTVRATYTDALTQRTFTDQRVIKTTVITAESR